jgi:hypothetical protein
MIASAAMSSMHMVAPDGKSGLPHDSADLIDREVATAWGRGRPCTMIS